MFIQRLLLLIAALCILIVLVTLVLQFGVTATQFGTDWQPSAAVAFKPSPDPIGVLDQTDPSGVRYWAALGAGGGIVSGTS